LTWVNFALFVGLRDYDIINTKKLSYDDIDVVSFSRKFTYFIE